MHLTYYISSTEIIIVKVGNKKRCKSNRGYFSHKLEGFLFIQQSEQNYVEEDYRKILYSI